MILGMASSIHNLIFLVTMILLEFMAAGQTNGSVPVGASITATDNPPSWPSSSGEFAFGFRQLEYEDHYLLSIWYDKIPEKTIVWYANGDDPAVKRGSKVQLTADRGLVLADPQGNSIWTSDISLGAVSYGVMNDTGNFVLQDRNSQKLWESFNKPTDTLLPTQIMENGGVVLSSRRTGTNFSLGRFQLFFQEDGNLVLNAINLPTKYRYHPYFNTGTADASNSTNTGYQLIFNESGYLYVLKRNGERWLLTKTALPTTDFYHRATLNFDGVLTQYFYPKTSSPNSSWSPVWSEPNNICVSFKRENSSSGACGYNSICSLSVDQRPSCNCPQGFSLFDQNDKHGSCKPDFDLSCQDGEQNSTENLYDFLELRNVGFVSADYEKLQPYNEDDCRKSCLNDCLCGAAIFSVNSCSKMKLPLSNGSADSGFNGKTLVKFRKGSIPPANPAPQIPETKTQRDIKMVTGIVLLSICLFVNFMWVGTFCFCSSFTSRSKATNVRGEKNLETNLRSFTFKELAEATEDFKDELGRGAFGVVYKGVLDKGSTNFVAVKKLDGVVREGDKEFRTEVNVISQTHHKNLVRLLGFCDEGQHRLLVYECLSNGTLANFLFGSSRPSWKQRTQIAFDIARGLLYLHEECSTQIIHCDIKPQNILLDDYYNARISDFGLAKLLGINQSQTKTAMRGTKGYVAPEWFRNIPVTVKVDVYSFGVLLLEIICCRRSVDQDINGVRAILTDWAYDCYRYGTLNALIEDDIEAMNDKSTLERLLNVAIWCIQEEPSLRPTMRKVTQMLEGVVEVPAPPNPCPFITSSST